MDECSEESVLTWLLKAVSQDPKLVLEASQHLQVLSCQLPYYRVLTQIFPHENVPYDIRLLCLTQLKEFVTRFWVASRCPDGGSLAISEDEREWFRNQLLANIHLPDARLQQLLAVSIAKIARSDWPDQWPQLLSTLTAEFDRFEADPTGLSAANNAPLAVLVHVVKSFASRRLPAHRRLFLDFAGQMMPLLRRGCAAAMTTFQAGLEGAVNANLSLLIERLRHLANIFRCLVESGLKDSQPCKEFLPLLRSILSFVVLLLSSEERLLAAQVGPPSARLLAKLSRLLLSAQELKPRSFAPLIRDAVSSLVLPWSILAAEGPSVLRTPQLQRNLLNLLHVLFTCPQYRPRLCGPRANQEEVAAAAAARQELLAAVAPNLTALLRHLVLRELVLTAADEAEWLRDFEGRAFPQDSEQEWRYGLRGCVQSLLLLLCTEFDEDAPRITLGIVQECLEAVPGPHLSELDASRRREAALGVLGHVAAWLSPEVQFDRIANSLLFPSLCRAALSADLSPELRLHDALLRRRVLWLLGELCGDQLSSEHHLSALLDCLWEYLSPQHECLLRLQAARTLSKVLSVLDDFEAGTAAFDSLVLNGLPFAFENLLQLLQSVRECSTKVALVQVMKLCVFNLQYSAARTAALRQLAPRLAAFWAAADPAQPLLRVALLELYSELVGALGGESVVLYDFACSLIEAAVPVSPEDEDSLLEAGLAFWHNFLASAQLLELPDKGRLVALFPRTLPHLERCNDVTLDCLQIAEAFAVVAGAPFMEANAAPLAAVLTTIVESAEQSLADAALVTVEAVFKLYPRPDALRMFEALLRNLVVLLMASGVDEGGELRANHLCVLARALLASPALFEALLLSVVGAEAVASAIALLASRCRQRMLHWSSQRQRKLMGLAVAAVIGAFGPGLPLGRCSEQFAAFAEALFATANDLEPAPGPGPAQRTAVRLLSTSSSSGEDPRTSRALPAAKRAAFAEEPVLRCGLRESLGEALAKLRTGVGEAMFEGLLRESDPALRQHVLAVLA